MTSGIKETQGLPSSFPLLSPPILTPTQWKGLVVCHFFIFGVSVHVIVVDGSLTGVVVGVFVVGIFYC